MSPFLSMCVLVFPFMYAQNYRMNIICFAWYELYYQKFFPVSPFVLPTCAHLHGLWDVYSFTSLFTLELRPPDPNGHRARWWSNVLQDAWASETQSNDFRVNEWCNFSNEKRGWSMYDQIDSNCIYWLHTPSTYEYGRNPYTFMMSENAKLHYSSCFFLDYITANCYKNHQYAHHFVQNHRRFFRKPSEHKTSNITISSYGLNFNWLFKKIVDPPCAVPPINQVPTPLQWPWTSITEGSS